MAPSPMRQPHTKQRATSSSRLFLMLVIACFAARAVIPSAIEPHPFFTEINQDRA
jgi:hypothetical protein